MPAVGPAVTLTSWINSFSDRYVQALAVCRCSRQTQALESFLRQTASYFYAQAGPDAFPDLSNVGFIHTANVHAQIRAALLDDILGLGPRELKTRLEAAIALASFENQSELNLA